MSYPRPQFSAGGQSFDRGYLEAEADALPDNASPDAKNCLLINPSRPGESILPGGRAVLRRRYGCRPLVAYGLNVLGGSFGIDGLFEFQREVGAAQLLAVCDGLLYLFDGGFNFANVSGGTGFTPGNAVRALPFRGNLLVSDGVQNLRFDGTAAFPVGFLAPTAAPALAVGAATGVTGTYEGYAVWYDSATGHESSPSATSSAVAFANQQRSWTKPAGSPPANVTHWRIYCRRVDTNERNFFRCAQVAVATGSVSEATSDAARTNLGPNPSDNDVPPAFAFMEEYKGFRFGVKADSSDVYVSAQYDAESQHPAHVFPVGGRADSKPVRCLKKYGEECLAQKPTRTYRVIGDRLPFQFLPVKSSLGNVAHEAGLEVGEWYYAWDANVGPYRTNLSAWEPLADARLAQTLATVNANALHLIRGVHVPAHQLVLWAVPVGSATRKRLLVAWHYGHQCWLPPITGLEYASLTLFTPASGQVGVYVGDHWGRVWVLFAGERDAPALGTVSGTITSASPTSLTVAGAAFNLDGTGGVITGGLGGVPIAIRSASGRWLWARVASNTADTLTIDTVHGAPLSPVPASDGSATVYIGAIEWYWRTPHLHHGFPAIKKLGRWLRVEARVVSATHVLELEVSLDHARAIERAYRVTFPSAGLVWGVGQWGVDAWGGGAGHGLRKMRLSRSYHTVQLRFANFYPDQPFVLLSYGVDADPMIMKVVASAG